MVAIANGFSNLCNSLEMCFCDVNHKEVSVIRTAGNKGVQLATVRVELEKRVEMRRFTDGT